MLHIKSVHGKMLSSVFIISFLLLSACSKDDNPVGSDSSTSKVSGRVTTTNGSPNILGKAGSTESNQGAVQGAVVTLAQVQADGSLKTVSTQSVQTDVNGKFVVETNLSGTKNLVVVAEQGSTKWKAIVSSTVSSGTTVYAPPLNDESSTEADLYIKVVGEGHSNDVSEADLKLLLNAIAASHISGNANAKSQFINAVQAKSHATIQAASNSYFGFSNSQIQAMANAKESACAKLDEDLYMSGDSETEVETAHINYESAVISTCASSNISTSAYAELRRIGLSAYTSASSSMEAQARFELTKCYYKRYAIALNFAMSEQFQVAGASNTQLNTVTTAGITLYGSIKNSTDVNQINEAFVQYHSTIKSQLQITLNAYANLIDTLDATINASGSTKALLNAALSVGATTDIIINAYITFFNSVKTSTQTTLAGASSTQVNAASQILILANMN